MQLFYIPQAQGQSIVLPEDQSKHCVRVLRMGRGQTIQLVDGKGRLFHCIITDDNPKRCVVEVERVEEGFAQRSFRLHIAMAPTKNLERFEWFLEKSTEMGIDAVTPLICERSERRTINRERLERILISSMKQSVKAYLPQLHNPIPIAQFVAGATEELKLMAHCGQSNPIHLADAIVPQKSVAVLIGPEGDFSPAEVALAQSHGFVAVHLGTSRLRTETAGVYACCLANASNRQ